ncbi:hypothetical protein CK203_003415 [Vitis vinifera]|uniref:Uncharacterized protein n=1 Tax=Vitis vinifera TaxID=29760 RepID=A0A438K7F0_VITVI|nr:hypothetical protein CK203_003415 [Vitis vinifera]
MWDKWRMLVLICVLRWGPSFIMVPQIHKMVAVT